MNNSYILSTNMITINSSSSISVNSTNIIGDVRCVIQNIVQASNVSPVHVSLSKDMSIPLSIIRDNSSLEAMVLYLKEILNMKFSYIAELLNRDQRTIWVTYTNAKKKKIKIDMDNNSQLTLPLSIFTSRNFSILESIVFYLRTNYGLTFNQISDLLGKNYRTIWTVYKRALRKIVS
jgi:predicted DNA-binding protein (UPF0251 family)